MSDVAFPAMLGGLPVVVACPPERFTLVSNGRGMWGSVPGVFQRFDSLAVCADEKSGGVFVFWCAATWEILADDWYETAEQALDALTHQCPGIELVRIDPSG